MIILKSNQGLLRKGEKQPVDFLTLVVFRFSEKKKKKQTFDIKIFLGLPEAALPHSL